MSNLYRVLFILIIIIIGGCGGSEGFTPAKNNQNSSPLIQTGVFIDSAVEGLRYRTGNLHGFTDSKGTFKYINGNEVSFYVGDIFIGKAKGNTIITPVDLIADTDDPTHPTVTNIARFLQTLDDDNIPLNGIKITSAATNLAKGKSISFAQSEGDFTNDANVQIIVSELTAATESGARSLILASAAQRHLIATLERLNTDDEQASNDSGSNNVDDTEIDENTN